MNQRHPNCKPMTIRSVRKPAVSLSRSRDAERLKLERDVQEFLARGGQITQVESLPERPGRASFFNCGPLQRGESEQAEA